MSLRDTLAAEVADLLDSEAPGVSGPPSRGGGTEWQVICCAATHELVRLLPSAYRDAVTSSYGERQPPCLDLVLDGRESPAAITRVDLDVMPLHEAAQLVGVRREGQDLRNALEDEDPEFVRPAVLAALRAVFAIR